MTGKRTPELDPGEMAAVVEEFNGFYIRLPSIQRLSFTTLSVLHTLARRSPLRLGELTATEQVTQSAITQVVTRLENDGLVERRTDPRDGRAVLVHITPGGSEVVAARHAEPGRPARADSQAALGRRALYDRRRAARPPPHR